MSKLYKFTDVVYDIKLCELMEEIYELKEELVDKLNIRPSKVKYSYIIECLNGALHELNNARRNIRNEPSLEARDRFEEEWISDLNKFLSIPEEPVREVILTGDFYEGLEEEYSAFLKKKRYTNK